jgi:hypothetical protein
MGLDWIGIGSGSAPSLASALLCSSQFCSGLSYMIDINDIGGKYGFTM